MVPDPMISTPFSAWILRIENMRSCLRIVDAPSTPSSSDIATSSAGVFFLSSFKCMWIVFSWGVVLELLKTDRKLRDGRTPEEREMERAADNRMELTGAARESRYVWVVPLSISSSGRKRRID